MNPELSNDEKSVGSPKNSSKISENKRYKEDEEIVEPTDEEAVITRSQGRSIAEKSLVTMFYEKGIKAFPKTPISTSIIHSDSENCSQKSAKYKNEFLQRKYNYTKEVSVRWSQIEKEDYTTEDISANKHDLVKETACFMSNKQAPEISNSKLLNSLQQQDSINKDDQINSNKVDQNFIDIDMSDDEKNVQTKDNQIDQESNNDNVFSDNPLSADIEDNNEDGNAVQQFDADKLPQIQSSQIFTKLSQVKENDKAEIIKEKQNKIVSGLCHTNKTIEAAAEVQEVNEEKKEITASIKVPEVLQNNYYEHKPVNQVKHILNANHSKNIKNVADRMIAENSREKGEKQNAEKPNNPKRAQKAKTTMKTKNCGIVSVRVNRIGFPPAPKEIDAKANDDKIQSINRAKDEDSKTWNDVKRSRTTDRNDNNKTIFKPMQKTLLNEDKRKPPSNLIAIMKNLVKIAKEETENNKGKQNEIYHRPYEMNFSDDEKKNRYVPKKQQGQSKQKLNTGNINDESIPKSNNKFKKTPKWKQQSEVKKKISHVISTWLSSNISVNSDWYTSDQSQTERSVYS